MMKNHLDTFEDIDIIELKNKLSKTELKIFLLEIYSYFSKKIWNEILFLNFLTDSSNYSKIIEEVKWLDKSLLEEIVNDVKNILSIDLEDNRKNGVIKSSRNEYNKIVKKNKEKWLDEILEDIYKSFDINNPLKESIISDLTKWLWKEYDRFFDSLNFLIKKIELANSEDEMIKILRISENINIFKWWSSKRKWITMTPYILVNKKKESFKAMFDKKIQKIKGINWKNQESFFTLPKKKQFYK